MRYLYCHPLFDERKCAHRFSYTVSKAFEKNSLKLERFDYRGTGEADGAFCEITLDSLRKDLQTEVGHDTVCLIGTRFGATAAFDYGCQDQSAIRTLVLIEPVVSGQGYVEYLFRKQHLKDMMTGNHSELANHNGFCNLEGYKTSSRFLEQIRQLNLFEIQNRLKAKVVFIAQISASENINPEYDVLAGHLRKNGIQAVVEVFNLPVFWERIPDGDYSILTEKIVEWCR